MPLRTLQRYRPYVIMVVAAALVVAIPSSDGGDSVTTTASGASATATGVAGASVGGSDAPVGSPLDARVPTRPRAPGATGTVSASVGTPRPGDVGGYPGVGAAEALAGPNCDRQRERVRYPSLHSPPCVRPWPKGAGNGGATAQGVTADRITIVVYHGPPSEQQRAQISDERRKEVMRRVLTMRTGTHETWGRKLDVQFFEWTGEDEVAQRADAIEIANRIKPFVAILADFTAVRRVWAADLAARGVIVWTPSITSTEAGQRPGHRWGAGPDDRLHAQLVGEYVAKRLYGRPAQWAGDPTMRVQARKFGLLHDEVWDPKLFQASMQRYRPDAVVTDAIPHDPQESLASLAERGQVQVARLKDKGVNNVVAVTGIFPTLAFTRAATAQNFFPEWTVTGWAQQDNAVTGKLYDQQQWRNAFGIGHVPVRLNPADDGEVQYQYQWVYGEPMSSAEQAVAVQLGTIAMPVVTAVHLAGPQLTMETFRAGLFSALPSGGRWCGCVAGYGAISFGRHLALYGADKHSMFEDFAEKYWDPATVGEDEIGITAPGVWRFLTGGKRYVLGEFAGGEPPMFDAGGTVYAFDGYQNLPPNDRYPRYEK